MENQIYSGKGSLKKLDEILPRYKNILLIGFSTHRSSELTYPKAYFEELKRRFNFTVFHFDAKALPFSELVILYQKVNVIKNIDLFIGLGGGTVIDAVKILSLAYANETIDFDRLLHNNQLDRGVDLCLIPTTAGTGSEATSFAVVYRDLVKYSIVSQKFLPQFTILDPGLLLTLPVKILHSTVLDALAQAIESIWAVNSNAKSKEYAKKAITRILANIGEPYSIENYENLQLASYYSGQAINISKTTLSHSISYPLTSYFGIPHGIAVFLTIPKVAEFNFYSSEENCQESITSDRIKQDFFTLFHLFGSKNIDQLIRALDKILEKLKIKSSLNHYGVKKEDLKKIAKHAITKGRADNNPRKADPRAIYEILEKIF